MNIRRISSDDAAQVASLSAQFDYPASEAEMRSRIQEIADDPNHGTFVAETDEGQAIGWIHVYGKHGINFSPYAEVTGLVVDSSHRGQGIGRQLLRKAEKWAWSRGFSKIALRSQIKREDAHRFYIDAGYEKTKTSHQFSKNLN